MDCIVVKKNLGPGQCFKLPQLIRGMITTPVDFKLTTANLADAATFKTTLQNAILATLGSRVFFWPFFVGFENNSEEAIYEDNPLADIAVRDGKYRFRAMLRNNMLVHRNMYSHRGSMDQRAYFIDNRNQLFGYEDPSNGDFYGFLLSMLNTEKLMLNDGSVATKSPIYMVLADNTEIDQAGALQDVGFINTLKRLTDVELVVDSVDNADPFYIYVSVKVKADGTVLTGLAQADFVATETDGDAQAITAMQFDATTGLYRLTKATAWVDGSVNLVAASALSIQAYESLGAAEIDAP